MTLMMEFQGMDVLLPGGHGLRLVMTETGEDYLAPACGLNCPVHVISDASSILSLPTIIRDPTSALQVPLA